MPGRKGKAGGQTKRNWGRVRGGGRKGRLGNSTKAARGNRASTRSLKGKTGTTHSWNGPGRVAKSTRFGDGSHGTDRSLGWNEHTGGKKAWNHRGPEATERNRDKPDRPADASANLAAAPRRGDTPQGTTAATERPSIGNWYHRSDLYSNPELTKSTSVAEWQQTKKRNT